MMRFLRFGLALALALATEPLAGWAQAGSSVSLTAIDTTYNQDFNTLAIVGTSSTVPAGWEFTESGTNANSTYTAGTGSSNAGDTYSFGPAGNTNRALGGLQSGSLIPVFGAAFTNDTGTTITTLDIAYTGEQWRLGTLGRLDRTDFQYSLDATSLTSGTWIDVDALDFVAPTTGPTVGALDGDAIANRRDLAASIAGLAITPGATVRIRWTDFNASGADDGLAVEDFSITPRAGGATALSIGDVSLQEGDGGSTTASFTVTVSTAAHSGVTFDLATADGSATTADLDYVANAVMAASIAPGDTTYTFDVTVNGDTAVEADETFEVRVSSVSGAILAKSVGTGTIVNDDEPPPVTTDVVISQVYGGGGNSGATFTHDFVELFNRGTAPVSLDGWSIQYTSATGTGTWQVTALSGSIAPGGYYLVQQARGAAGTTPLPPPDATGSIAMGAGAGKVALQTDAAAIVGQCPLTGTADLVGYGGANCFEGAGPTSAPGNTTAVLRKRGGCFDSDHNTIDFAIGNPFPRNSASPARSCEAIAAPIHDIQGDGPVSPLANQDVTTTGVVTGIKTNGFFLQTPDAAADANPMTSEAIFVFTSSTPAVVAGNEVSVRGTAGEFFALTQIEASLPGDISILSTAVPLPVPVVVTPVILDPAGTPDQLERFEGMRMFASSLTSVAPTDDFGEIATVLTGVPRPLREPGISVLAPVPPDPSSGVPDCCIPRFDENPERLVLDSEGLLGQPVLFVTSNVVLSDVSGPLDFTFGRYKLLPEMPPAASANMTAIAVPSPAADEFTVGTFNIENFAGNETQRRKASLAIRQLMQSPDVIGVIEVLSQDTLQTLADQLNADALAAGEVDPAYTAHLIPAPPRTPGGPVGTQNVGFLVKTSRVRVDEVSQERAAEVFVNPSGGTELLHDRPPLVLRVTVDADGLNPRPAIVVVNHLRSFIDIELVGGEGPRVRAKRTAQAESVAGLLQELQVANGDVAVISIGDYNAFQFNDGYTDPIAVLKGSPTPDNQVVVDESPDLVDPDFVNLTDGLPAAERYSFIFEGSPQALDHVLGNPVAASYVQRYAVARGNADFPASPFYVDDATRPERASDHDMPVAYLRFPPPSADLRLAKSADATTVAAGGQVTFTLTVSNDGVSPAQDVVVSDQLPSHLVLTSCSATGGGICGGTAATPTVSYGSIAAGVSETVTLVGTVACATPDGAELTNAAMVSAATADPDSSNNSASSVVTALNSPPTIADAAPGQSSLIPNNQWVAVQIAYDATDACGPVTTSLSVSSNEPVTAPLSEQGIAGRTSPDWIVVDARTVQLRAERSARGDGRVYTITITATDEAGGTTTAQVTVTVPQKVAAGQR